MGPKRLLLFQSLLESLNLEDILVGFQLLSPMLASRDMLLSAHDEAYVEAVAAETPNYQFGLGTGDCPIFEGVFGASRLISGGTVVATKHAIEHNGIAFNTMAGLHHARRGNASGFCYFNDCVIGINHALSLGKERILYLDTDCHAGDGVSAFFYDRNDVFTLSAHESGRFLYPGCCFEDEVGEGDGLGFNANLPLHPLTDDHSYSPPVLDAIDLAFEIQKPDMVFWQWGMDIHHRDPITHVGVSTYTNKLIAERVREHIERLDIPIVCMGGGGYDIFAVAKGWIVQFLALAGVDPIPEPPQHWIEHCVNEFAGGNVDLCSTILGQKFIRGTEENREEILLANRRTFETMKTNLLRHH